MPILKFDNSKKNETVTNITFDPETNVAEVKLFTTAENAQAVAKRLDKELVCCKANHLIQGGKNGTADQVLRYEDADKGDVVELINALAVGGGILTSQGAILAKRALELPQVEESLSVGGR